MSEICGHSNLTRQRSLLGLDISSPFVFYMDKHLFTLVLLAASAQALATNLPPPSRTVYKCEVGGKVHYSDSPCVGAQKVDVTPTRGMNKSTGRELTGADVRREVFREQLSDAVRPITGMNAQQLDHAGRRMKLSSEAQVACRQLDQALPLAEQAERAAQGSSGLKAQQVELFKLRKRYRELGCE